MTLKSGINNAMVRVENRKKLTELLYKEQGLTKQELAMRLHLSLPTVNLLVQQLEEEGLIYYQSSAQSSGGRIPSLVCFKYDAYISVGAEISKNHIRLLLINMAGSIMDSTYDFCRFESSMEYWQGLRLRVDAMLEKNNIKRSKMIGMGVAIPGPVKPKEKKVSSWLLGLEEYSYADLEEILGCPVIIENDANSAGFAEIFLREDIQDAAYLSVSKGVGGAIINKRKVIRGQNNCSGEFGHLMIVPNGRKCLCGRKGCLDMYCSTDILARSSQDSLASFFENKDKDEELQKLWDEYLECLAIGVSNIALIMDIPVIVGGELTPYLEKNFQELQEKIEALDPFKRTVAVSGMSVLGGNGAAVGAALLVVLRFLNIL